MTPEEVEDSYDLPTNDELPIVTLPPEEELILPPDPNYVEPPPEFPGCKKPDERGFIGCDDTHNTMPGSTTIPPPPNLPPVCTTAVIAPTKLWPPNHQYELVTITGYSDPEGQPLDFRIVEITQDEPVRGLGSGDTAPDAKLENSKLYLRAERAGRGNGRTYRVQFSVADESGQQCFGTVKVGVPKSNNGAPAVENPFRILSTG